MEISGGLKFLDRDEVFNKIGLKQGMSAACLGCGNMGYFIIPAAQMVGKDGQAYAVDIQNSVLDSVRHQATIRGIANLQIVRANLEVVGSTKIPAESLDAAFLINVLFQNKMHEQIIKEASRLIKKGGKLIAVDWKKIGAPFGPPVEIRVEPENVIKYATDAGLRLTLQTEFGQYFWGLIFEKV
jgi:ubiquinone/menaquinone biosynthesis C-methylase UbiE